MKSNHKAILVLEDGRVFQGISLGTAGEVLGEVCFNTSLTGYQEILTDPSYCGQMVTMTYPLIGNTGVNFEDVESRKPWLSGFIVKENSPIVSNHRAKGSLDEYLKKHNICGLQGIDTRSLVRHIRTVGALKGAISTVDFDLKRLVKKVKKFPGMAGKDLVKEVTCKEVYKFQEGVFKKPLYHVVVVDCGVKKNILRQLVSLGCTVTVVPASTSASDILQQHPSGVLLSNGPGDPEPVTDVIQMARELMGKVALFGICLGHQILGLALGGKTYKMKFGHRGGNQPVMYLPTKKVEITSHNHGFSLDINSLKGKQIEVTHINLNDQTVEGFRHKKFPLCAVQYHPEAAPGPHDASYLFQDFINMMKGKRHAKTY